MLLPEHSGQKPDHNLGFKRLFIGPLLHPAFIPVGSRSSETVHVLSQEFGDFDSNLVAGLLLIELA